MTPLPRDATSYLLQLHKAYRTGSTEDPDYLVMYVSPNLMAMYEAECRGNARYTSDIDVPVHAYYLCKARVKADPDMQGFNIRYLEDKYAWQH